MNMKYFRVNSNKTRDEPFKVIYGRKKARRNYCHLTFDEFGSSTRWSTPSRIDTSLTPSTTLYTSQRVIDWLDITSRVRWQLYTQLKQL